MEVLAKAQRLDVNNGGRLEASLSNLMARAETGKLLFAGEQLIRAKECVFDAVCCIYTCRRLIDLSADCRYPLAVAKYEQALAVDPADEVRFQEKNPDFLLKNPELLSGILISY